MEVTSTVNKDEEIPKKLNVDIDDAAPKQQQQDNNIKTIEVVIESVKEEDEDCRGGGDFDYEEDSGDDIAVITKTTVASIPLQQHIQQQGDNSSTCSPAKTMFSIKTVSNLPLQSNYKISKTAIDLDHPGNINGVPTIDYDLSKLNDECKPWKKPGADVSDFFNYGFTEETWLLYCEKQKSLRLSQENSAIKTLSGLPNFGYNLSGSHIHLGFNRANQKNPVKGGIIDVIGGCQQSNSGDFKNNKHNNDISQLINNNNNKISSIPVQTGHMGGSNHQVLGGGPQGNNYMAISNNLLNPLMSALAMGMIPGGGAHSAVLNNQQQNMSLDNKLSQYSNNNNNQMDGGASRNYNNNWNNNNNINNNNNNNNGQQYERQNSIDSMHSHEDYGERKSSYIKSERGNKRDESHHYRSRDKREKSTEKRRHSRSRSRDRGHDSKYSRSSKRNRSPDDNSGSRRRKKYSRERASSSESSKRRHHRSSKKQHRQSSKSRSRDSRKDRRHRHKTPTEDSDKHKSNQKDNIDDTVERSEQLLENIKREKEAASQMD